MARRLQSRGIVHDREGIRSVHAATRRRSRVSAYTLALTLALGCASSNDRVAKDPPRFALSEPTERANDSPHQAPSNTLGSAALDSSRDAGADAGSVPRSPPPARPRRVRPADERAIRETLASAEIVLVERGHGGRSLAFRLTFADGTRGYFKPEQTFSGMHWYAEIAAYHLDRALGLRRTPIVVGRSIAWSALATAAGSDRRIREIVIGEDGMVRGAVVRWIEERLVPLRPPIGWERWIRLDPAPSVSPFVSPRAWYRAVEHPRVPEALDPEEIHPGEPDTAERAAELSDLVVFDYLVHNTDRWSANSTNVRTHGEQGPLVYLDQAAGFSPRRARLRLMDARLESVQRFRRSTIDSVRALDLRELGVSLDRDPLAPILGPRQLEHLAERQAHVIELVEALIAEHGEAQVYAW